MRNGDEAITAAQLYRTLGILSIIVGLAGGGVTLYVTGQITAAKNDLMTSGLFVSDQGERPFREEVYRRLSAGEKIDAELDVRLRELEAHVRTNDGRISVLESKSGVRRSAAIDGIFRRLEANSWPTRITTK